MDITTVVGMVMAIALLLWSLTAGAGGIGLFIDVPSMVMVGGGTIAVTLVSFRAGDLKGLVKVMFRTVLFKLPAPPDEIERIISYANLARKEGLLALEAKLQRSLIGQPNQAEAVRANLEKRAPKFRDRA